MKKNTLHIFYWGIRFVVLFFPMTLMSQELTLPHYGEGTPQTIKGYMTNTLESGEVLPWFPIQEVVITARRTFSNAKKRQEYLRLRKNVIRVLPYAIYAQKRYEQLDRDLALVRGRREERKLIKACESEIKEKIKNEVKNMTISQGQILVKLIERQTGNTSFEMLKDIKGGLTAGVYQGIAKLFGHNLRATYDPQEDYEIENIIREYERKNNIKRSPYQ